MSRKPWSDPTRDLPKPGESVEPPEEVEPTDFSDVPRVECLNHECAETWDTGDEFLAELREWIMEAVDDRDGATDEIRYVRSKFDEYRAKCAEHEAGDGWTLYLRCGSCLAAAFREGRATW